MDIPLGLRHALETGNCVLFLGAGIGVHLKNRDGVTAPLGTQLAKELAEHFGIEVQEAYELAKISKIVELRRGRTELENFLKKRLADLEPDGQLAWLFSQRWKAIFTTNYDNSIQRGYEMTAEPKQQSFTVTTTSELVGHDPRFQIPIYHLHGTLFGKDEPHIVITQDDYTKFQERRRMLFELLKQEFATSTVLYIGYSNSDPNWNLLMTEIAAEFYPSSLPPSYRVSPETDEIENEILRAKKVETLVGTYADFHEAAVAVLKNSQIDDDFIERRRGNIPNDLLEIFDSNPIPVTRLLASWEYVNQEAFDKSPNVQEFLKGDRANWALAGAHRVFERDIEDEVFEKLLDFATSQLSRPVCNVLVAPAGYGVTTLLLILAAKLVVERAGTVLMLKPGQRILEGDIEFARRIFSDNLFFFVDNAADYGEELSTVITRLGDIDEDAIFVVGERVNEWRQQIRKPSGIEFAIEALSDPEILRLLDFLDKYDSLGVLKPLDDDMRFSVIKEKHQKELLVAMREATEGRRFDAILEDEFRGIQSPIARKLYMIVCCFYQHGAYIRDKLLADLVGLSLTEMYDETADATEGVVVYELIDEGRGTYAARARHRVIATVVWERCGYLLDQEDILQASLKALNLNYPMDKDAFEYFVRSDRLVDTISTLEGKIQFFERAVRKDPRSPYVKQHYARMLLRARKFELARTQINEAINIDSNVRVLYHTKGKILASLAEDTESLDLARRHLVQSEDSFRIGLSMYPRDEYCYEGLANLYFTWAKRTPREESTQYLAKAEETIAEGLKKCRERDSLWLVSADIQNWLGNQPERMKDLEKAVAENPGSVVAKYLLGRAYRRAGKPEKTLEVLDSVIKQDFDEFRSFIEYAIAMIRLGESYSKAISTLSQSSTFGLSDPRYIGTLGGLLFLNGDFTQANAVFAESSKRNFSSKEMNTVQFIPPDPVDLTVQLRLTGKVVLVRTGYSLIETRDYPRFLCPGSKYHGVVMKEGLEVTFTPAFAAKGPIALEPELTQTQ